VWEALADVGDAAAIALRVHEQYPQIPADTIERDVQAFLAQLVAESLVEEV
jgi:hypothetical protein